MLVPIKVLYNLNISGWWAKETTTGDVLTELGCFETVSECEEAIRVYLEEKSNDDFKRCVL